MATVTLSTDGDFVSGTTNVALKPNLDAVLTLAAATTYTLPSATTGSIAIGSSFSVVVTNGATYTATFAAASGETLVGTATATASPTRRTFTRTGATEWTQI
jgi:hypothetical protein